MLAGSVKTVTPEQAIKRLESVAGVPMTAGGHGARVNDVAALRIRVVHFAMVASSPAGLQGSLARCLDFVLWFLDTEFRDQGDADVEELVEESIEALTTEVGQLKALVAERMKSIADELDDAELSVECPRCRQPALMLVYGDLARCGFCLWKAADGAEGATEYVDTVLGLSHHVTVKDGGEWPVHSCTSCGEEAMVEGIEQLRPDPATINQGESPCDCKTPAHWGCFSCGKTAERTELDRCTRCGGLTDAGDDDGLPVCSDCWADVLSD
jgi:DNA-directed RNA polymerase subunit RPC12/RpoP